MKNGPVKNGPVKTLITGGAGFIGSTVASACADAGNPPGHRRRPDDRADQLRTGLQDPEPTHAMEPRPQGGSGTRADSTIPPATTAKSRRHLTGRELFPPPR